MKKISLLGSTGSIGVQTLEVIEQHRDKFELVALTAHKNIDLLITQCRKWKPSYVVITDKTQYSFLKKALSHLKIKIWVGEEALSQVASLPEVDIVVVALVGFVGLLPTVRAIENKKTIALANKETLVVGGHIIIPLVKKHQVKLIPIDSEHSAIFQCLESESENKIEKIYLTASGGPFKDRKNIENITPEEALQHPTWNMGAKISIDSATMMNKALEIIEAKWLFDLEPEQIDVIIHPQSVIHSIVQFEDGSMKAQMGVPDMKTPIQYALSYPKRFFNSFPRFEFHKYPIMNFEKPDTKKFTSLAMAYYALKKGGNMPTIMNAANEVFVEYFLKKRISFLKIVYFNEICMKKITFLENPTLDDLVETDKKTRLLARDMITYT